MSTFHIRDKALPEDANFIVEAFDSTLPHLASIGSGSQWGSEPRSRSADHVQRIRTAIDNARTGTSDKDAVFIAEVPIDDDGQDAIAGRIRNVGGQRFLQVGAAVTKGSFPAYVVDREDLDESVRADIEWGDFVYLYVMISDYRAGALRKGAGAALARRVKQYARDIGQPRVYVDCWAGNDERLVGYVLSVQKDLIFHVVDD